MWNSGSVTILVSTQESSVFNFKDYTVGMFFTPSGLTGVAITFLVAPTVDGAYVPLEDAAGNPVTIVVGTSSCYALPAALAAAPFFKMKSGSSETGSDKVIDLSVK